VDHFIRADPRLCMRACERGVAVGACRVSPETSNFILLVPSFDWSSKNFKCNSDCLCCHAVALKEIRSVGGDVELSGCEMGMQPALRRGAKWAQL
jgi:hypothetical protein